jgi:hypothetical protein
MANTVPLKYDWVSGGHSCIKLAMAASQTFADRGGKFVDIASGYGETMDSSSSYIFGWVETAGHDYQAATATPTYFTTSATAGATVLNCIISPDAIFRMPVAYYTATYTVNYAYTLIGTARDIYLDTTSKVQFADLTTSTDDFIIILDGLAASTTFDYAATTGAHGDGWVLVRPNPAKMIAA